MFVREKADEIFELRDELDASGYLLHNNKSLVTLGVKDIRINTCSIIQRFIYCEKVQVMIVSQLHVRKDNVSNSKANLLEDATNFLDSGKRLTRCVASIGQLRSSQYMATSVTITFLSLSKKIKQHASDEGQESF